MLLLLSKVGQGAQGLPGTLCQKVLFCFFPLFLPVVSASKCSREVEECESKRRQADGQVGRSWSRNWTPIADRKRRTAGRKVEQVSPTTRLLTLSTAELGEQSENVYENKGRGKKSSGQAQALALTHPSPRSLLSSPSPRGRGLLSRFGRESEAIRENIKPGEQSENV